MVKHGLSTRPVLKGPKTAEELTSLQNAVFDVASQAHGHLDEAKKLVNKISMFSSRPGFMALFPSARSQIFLDDLRKADFNPYNPDLLGKLEATNRLQLQYSLMKLKYTNRIWQLREQVLPYIQHDALEICPRNIKSSNTITSMVNSSTVLRRCHCECASCNVMEQRRHDSARLEQQNSNLAKIEVDEMLCFVCHVGSKVATYNTVPRRVVFLVEFFLYVGSNILRCYENHHHDFKRPDDWYKPDIHVMLKVESSSPFQYCIFREPETHSRQHPVAYPPTYRHSLSRPYALTWRIRSDKCLHTQLLTDLYRSAQRLFVRKKCWPAGRVENCWLGYEIFQKVEVELNWATWVLFSQFFRPKFCRAAPSRYSLLCRSKLNGESLFWGEVYSCFWQRSK